MVWNAIKSSLLQSLSESEFSLWINPLECREQNEQCLDLIAPDRFFSAFVEGRYLEQMRQILGDMGMELDIRIKVEDKQPAANECNHGGQMRLPGITKQQSRYRSLHPAFTFDQFMVGESNMLAKSACSAIASDDRTYGHCLFMNSSTGLGKSHLTQAVVHQIFDQAPQTNLQYLTAQQFAADMVKNIRERSMDKFSSKYVQDCDVLLVEDVHTLIGKTKTQEELNAILDYLIKTGRRVILTSAVGPNKLKGLDEDFRSRMTSGLVTGINSPDYKTRMCIIVHKASVNNLCLSEDTADYLAQNLKGDIRKIESAVMGLKAKSCLLQQAPDQAMVKEVLADFICTSAELSGENIRDFICDQFKVNEEALRSRSRKRSLAVPRQIGMYITRKLTKESLADIGAVYNRDHSTVLHAIKVITREMTRQDATKKQIDMLCSKLKR